MRRFIINITLFLFPMLLFVFSLDYFLRSQKTTYSFKYEGAKSNSNLIEVLILGNSRACYGLNPSKFDLMTYNLANVSQTIYFDKRLVINLLDSLPQLKFVLISVDYHSLYSKIQSGRNSWSYLGNGIKFENTDYSLVDISPSIFGYNVLVSISFIKKYCLNYLESKNNFFLIDMEGGVKKVDNLNNGFFYFEGTENGSFEKSKYLRNRVKYFEELTNDTSQIDDVVKDLDDFIAVLKSKGVRPILITNPVHKVFFNELNTKKVIKNRQIITDFCLKHELSYWDFSSTNLFEKDDFKNPDHFNLKGANKYSIILNDSILKLN